MPSVPQAGSGVVGAGIPSTLSGLFLQSWVIRDPGGAVVSRRDASCTPPLYDNLEAGWSVGTGPGCVVSAPAGAAVGRGYAVAPDDTSYGHPFDVVSGEGLTRGHPTGVANQYIQEQDGVLSCYLTDGSGHRLTNTTARTFTVNVLVLDQGQPPADGPVPIRVTHYEQFISGGSFQPVWVNATTDSAGAFTGSYTSPPNYTGSLITGSTLQTPVQVQAQGRNGSWYPLWGHGVAYDAFTLIQSPTQVVDACTDPSHWFPDSNTAVSVVGGQVTLTVGPGSGFPGLLLPTLQDWSGFRWLRLGIISASVLTGTVSMAVRADPGGPLPPVTSKEWDFVASPAGPPPLDLCFPTRPVAPIISSSFGAHPAELYFDDQQSSWANRLYSPAASPVYTDPDGWLWGVGSTQGLQFLSLAPGVYTMTGLFLERRTATRISCLLSPLATADEGAPWPDPYHSGFGRHLGTRILLANTDRRRSLEAFAGGSSFPTAVNFITNECRSVAEVITYINSLPSWTATDLAPADAYWNNSRSAWGIGGGGLVWTAAQQWQETFDQDITAGAVTLQNQPLYSGIDFHSSAGDFLTYPGTARPPGEATILAFHIIRKQSIEGLTFDASGPVGGVDVDVNGTTEGTGQSGADGWYETGAPWLDSRVEPVTAREAPALAPLHVGDVVINPALGDENEACYRWRLSWRYPWYVGLGGIKLFNRHAPFGDYYSGDTLSGNVLVSRADLLSPPYQQIAIPATTEGTVTSASLEVRHDGHPVLLYSAAGNTYDRLSYDYGRTWSAPTMSIPDGTLCQITASQDRLILIRAAVVGGNIQATEEQSGAPQSPVFIFADASTPPVPLLVAGNGFGLSHGGSNDAPWLLHVVIQGETASSDWQSWDTCRTWKRAS